MAPVIKGKLGEVAQSIAGLDKGSFTSDLDRRMLFFEAQKLVTRLQTPLELTTTICHTNTFIMTAMKGLLALDLFNKWEKDGGTLKTSKQLTQLTEAPLSLIERLLRVVTTAGLLSTNGKGQNEDDLYVFTDFAKANASGKLWNYWYYHTLILTHCPTALPDHLRKVNFREPTNPADSPWATYMGKPIFEWLPANPQAFTYLNEVMAFKGQDSVPWFNIFPAEQLLDSTQGTLVVDIGGGTGNDLKIFQQEFASRLAPGQLVLQDLAQAIEEADELSSAIHKQVYDFFTEQPNKGSRVYYLHNVLHDWSEEECLKILARIKEAMKPSYSRLLIHENVLSLESTPFATATDMTMMVLNSGAERTEDQWRNMLTKAGLRIVRFHQLAGVDDGVIEVQLWEQ